MLRALSRLAVTATLPAAVFVATPAHAVTVPGCFGAVVVVCDLTVTVTAPEAVETYEYTVPICAGPCLDVPVTLVRSAPGDDGSICVSYEDRAGAVVYQNCRPLVAPTIPDLPDLPDLPEIDVVETVKDVNELVVDAIWEKVLCRTPVFENTIRCW